MSSGSQQPSKKKDKSKGVSGEGEKDADKEGDGKKTAAEVKEEEFGKVREAVNKSVVTSIAKMKKKKKGALTQVKKALGKKGLKARRTARVAMRTAKWCQAMKK